MARNVADAPVLPITWVSLRSAYRADVADRRHRATGTVSPLPSAWAGLSDTVRATATELKLVRMSAES